jgi:hypothetical protein
MSVHEADGRFEAAAVAGNVHELVDLVEVPEWKAGKCHIMQAASVR